MPNDMEFIQSAVYHRKVKGDVRAEIALQLRTTKLYCVLLGETPLHQSRIVDRRNARSARTSPFPDEMHYKSLTVNHKKKEDQNETKGSKQISCRSVVLASIIDLWMWDNISPSSIDADPK